MMVLVAPPFQSEGGKNGVEFNGKNPPGFGGAPVLYEPKVRVLLVVFISLALFGLGRISFGAGAGSERVQAIDPPAAPLPSEEQSREITHFSFILYGDTRGRRDGVALQSEHSMVVDGILTQIKKLKNTDSPVRFVLQTGDAVLDGQEARQWNVSFVPLINRITMQGGVPYFWFLGTMTCRVPAGLTHPNGRVD